MSSTEYEVTVRIEFPQAETEIDPADLEAAIRHVLSSQNVPDGASVTLVVTDSGKIRDLNRQFRGVDAPTDVLAFQSGPDEFPEPEGRHYLGDIVISYPVAARQAGEQGHHVRVEMILLAVHGTLHLLGYDHETDDERAEMWALQRTTLEALGFDEVAPE